MRDMQGFFGFYLAGLLGCSVALLSSPAQAELVECNGTWTNRACDSSDTKKLGAEDTRSPEIKEAAAIRSKKKSLFHELTMKAIKAKRQYQYDYDLEEVETFCFKQESSLADCKDRIKQARQEIDKEVTQFAQVRQQEQANKLREEANRIQKERNETVANPVVVIEERRNYYIKPRRYRGHPPIYREGHGGRYGHQGSRTAGGAAITVTGSGTLGNGSQIGVTGTVGGVSTQTNSTTTYGTTGGGTVNRARSSSRSGGGFGTNR